MKKTAILIMIGLLLVSSVTAYGILIKGQEQHRLLNDAGYFTYQNGDYDQATALFEEAIDLAPEYELARYNLALLDFELQDYDGAIEQLERLVALDPSNVHYHYDLAVNCVDRLRYADGDEDDYWCGVDHYAEAERLSPGFESAAENLAVLQSFLK